MKKFLLVLAIAIFVFPQTTFGYYQNWTTPKFDQDIEIFEDGKIRVKETIVADFSKDASYAEHHGIYREIPVKYDDQYGNNYNLRFNLISVTDENGKEHPLANMGVELFSNNMTIKIGEANVIIKDKTTYVITYEIDRVIGYHEEHDELYWNIFSLWEVPVESSTVTVTLPKTVANEQLKGQCYTGTYGSTSSNCTSEVKDGKLVFRLTQPLDAFDGFTIVAGFPKNIIQKPLFTQYLLWFLMDNWIIFLPIVVFFFFFYRWKKYGCDPQTNNTIIPHYEAPDDLSPTEVGTLIDERAEMHDIVSVIIDYAVKGYIKINEITEKKLLIFDNTDYELEVLKPYMEYGKIKPHEIEILNAIFDGKSKVKISDLKFKFYSKVKSIKKKIYSDMITAGYFPHNPENVRNLYLGIAGGIVFGAFTIAPVIIQFLGISGLIAIIISGLIIAAFSPFMPRKTEKGASTYYKIKGLEEYIRTAEKDRIKFQEKNNIFFEKLLPYAMVLGLGEKWANAFSDLYKGKPEWFNSSSTDAFNTLYLIDRLSHFQSQANTAFASAPRSSGGSSAWGGGSGFSGGFSGGGFGGGGGGSW
ncbi:DUF2207 domain-containing protein [Patescibacteria group bacterium]|nr:DUF2207 domain-containing protein [Patescibacteria group bacterium]